MVVDGVTILKFTGLTTRSSSLRLHGLMFQHDLSQRLQEVGMVIQTSSAVECLFVLQGGFVVLLHQFLIEFIQRLQVVASESHRTDHDVLHVGRAGSSYQGFQGIHN